MSTKNQSFTLDEEVLSKLSIFASKECISRSSAVNKILKSFLNIEVKVGTEYTPPKKIVVQPIPELTPEKHLAEWEWRRRMVNEGKFPTYMAEEFPIVEMEGRKAIYLTPDGLPSDDISKIRKVVPPQKTQEEIDFDESLKMSLEETFGKPPSTQSLTDEG